MKPPNASQDEHARDAAGERDRSQPSRRVRTGSGSATPPVLPERKPTWSARHRRGPEPGSGAPGTEERPEGAELLDYEPDTGSEADPR